MRTAKIKYDCQWEATVQIHDSPETVEMMKEQLLFWMGGQERIDDEDGDIEKAYLKMLGQEMIRMSMRLNAQGIKNEFEEMEGWASLDGKFGVTLIRVDNWEFSASDFDIETA